MLGDGAVSAVFLPVVVCGVAAYIVNLVLVRRARWIANAQRSPIEADALPSPARVRRGATVTVGASIAVDRSLLQLTLPTKGSGWVRRYSIRRDSVDSLVVDAGRTGTRLRVMRGGRPARILTIWVPGPAHEWREQLASLGWAG